MQHNRPSSDISQGTLTSLLRRDLELGIAMAEDPDNAGLPDLAIRVTTMHSPWFSRTCRVCRDKFREGDLVRLCPRCGEPYHDDGQYALHCWKRRMEEKGGCLSCDWQSTNPPSEQGLESSLSENRILHASPPESIVTQFIEGVETIWRPHGEQKVFKVPVGSNLIGRNCPWCRFRVRAGDWVVKCPCGKDCGTFFHQDIFRHLTCWNEWNGVAGNDYCPTTGAEYISSVES
uniref:Uncharacterized protein n=1 Tax=Candidatus Kentrum sp. FM TaxID=2126340 RepID=A0A450SDV3_9GAMM|nr:MAG: hypothetical protein BECKFM1743C_GA0114222_1008810 [Candidatus Kentron sp. FM]VFJ50779.1 MAG: hypothetical protein BECKFM1743A_GA0114220_1008710 [Candidatus Kentron sp. FM]VFK08765.1 MAG: hypothetical protein BECKFM1743B_GA0114221_1008010 [Candidatus Kentron sp. FM]